MSYKSMADILFLDLRLAYVDYDMKSAAYNGKEGISESF
jgi:hypothetical protein